MKTGASDSGPRYGRILLKLSGEALAGGAGSGIDALVLSEIADEIREVRDLGVQIGVVVGAGNIFRGGLAESLGIPRVTGDQMGMLATVMNSLALQSAIERGGAPARVMCPFGMKEIAEPYIIRKALDHLEHNRVVIASGGTGQPFFTTDTAAALRAVELKADLLLKATRVDGVHAADPKKDPSARIFESISYIDVLAGQLRVMDSTAISLCMENRMPIRVFNLFNRGSLRRIVSGESIGTLIS